MGYVPGTEEDRYGMSVIETMHYIPRSQGGLGIAENAALGCQYHHRMLDNGSRGRRAEMLEVMAAYLRQIYPEWDEDNLVYKKGDSRGRVF